MEQVKIIGAGSDRLCPFLSTVGANRQTGQPIPVPFSCTTAACQLWMPEQSECAFVVAANRLVELAEAPGEDDDEDGDVVEEESDGEI